MLTNVRSKAAVGVAALAATALLIAAPANAATAKGKFQITGGAQKGTTITGNVSGPKIGSCKMKAQLILPKLHQTWTCKGGTIKIESQADDGTKDAITGSWKVIGGTGKFKGATGGGKQKGVQSKGEFTYTGSIKY